MQDLLIVGGGPAGAIAGLVAARAGARVRILDRSTFPRHKLCGDSLNPGALAILERLGVADPIEASGLPVAGMIVTGEGGVVIEGRYPRGLLGRSILRRDLDAILLDAAIAAGCSVETGVLVRRAIVDEDRGAPSVSGVVVASRRGERSLRAPVVIATDGRRSRLTFALGLARHPARPRRWAIGAYLSGVGPRSDPKATDATRTRDGSTSTFALGVPTRTSVAHPASIHSDPNAVWGRTAVRPQVGRMGGFGEMHVRRNCYIGVAPVPDGLTNVCLVVPAIPGSAALRDPTAVLTGALAADPLLRDRFADAELTAPPVVLGPLAVDATGRAIDGLIAAGDAAGFIDPMTGDGLRFAIRGGELAADAALRALATGWHGVHDAIAAARADAFGGKWRFNRALRSLVASPRAVHAAAVGARLAPAALRAVIARAGDCDLAR